MGNERHIRVVRGQPDERELTALTVVLLARARGCAESARTAKADWVVKGGGYRSPAAWANP